MITLLDDVIRTDYGQFTLLQGDTGFDGDVDRFFADQINGWVGAGVDGAVHVVLGRRSGGSSVRVELHEAAPPLDDAEDIVEVSFSVGEGPVRFEGWAGDPSGSLDIPAGRYRVRVSARGRDAGHAQETADALVDWYVLQLWPAPPRPDEIVRTTSADAAYWNDCWGGRRIE
ncbi:hypothetical protein [uncultured Microbacterium sp.]|uniref:hypothetical protein n=1 Tax=uncultured Microbacterium sp. TaxID=191216 RepID=UPI0028DB4C90|nr:hypothetical protein [uncultured Microbacterium sp.]